MRFNNATGGYVTRFQGFYATIHPFWPRLAILKTQRKAHRNERWMAMHFFYQISPATWFKIGLFSLLLGCASAWYLFGSKMGMPKLTINTSNKPTSDGATGPAGTTGAVSSHHTAQQLQAIAPEGILDQYVEFAELLAFEDSEIKPDFVLPPAIAPIGLLDPDWIGATP